MINHIPGYRPGADAQIRTWSGDGGVRTPGIALVRNRVLLAHLTPAEARVLADRIHDLAGKFESHE